jgi:hypothetical protein
MKFAAPASALIAASAMTAPASTVIKLKTDRKPPPDVAVRIVAAGGTINFIVSNPRAGVTISSRQQLRDHANHRAGEGSF